MYLKKSNVFRTRMFLNVRTSATQIITNYSTLGTTTFSCQYPAHPMLCQILHQELEDLCQEM